jgi:S-adenosylmethionine synthetase
MYLFASEAVSAGHPDKCADIISDSIVDTLLQLDPDSKVATEVFISGKHIIIGGEVKTKVPLDAAFYEEIGKKALKKIGYPEVGLCEYPWEKLDELAWFRGLKG